MVGRYWSELSSLPIDLLQLAFTRAHREFPDFFPSLGQLEDFCSATAKRMRSGNALKALPEVSSAPGVITPEISALIRKVGSL